MGDQGGFDPCECINFQELAMRRLLNMLRQSQSYCTDTECVQDVIQPSRMGLDNNFLFFGIVIAMAFLMFFMRPNARRNEVPEKPCINQNHGNGAPPTPPPSSC